MTGATAARKVITDYGLPEPVDPRSELEARVSGSEAGWLLRKAELLASGQDAPGEPAAELLGVAPRCAQVVAREHLVHTRAFAALSRRHTVASAPVPRELPCLDALGELRLWEIARLDLAAAGEHPGLTELAAEAARLAGTPQAAVSVVLRRMVHLAGRHGLGGWMKEAGGLPAAWAPCALVVRAGRSHLWPDLTSEPRLARSPLVLRDGIRFYAGVPLVTEAGSVVGTLCVFGREPRPDAPGLLQGLSGLAEGWQARCGLEAAPSTPAPAAAHGAKWRWRRAQKAAASSGRA